MNTTGGNMLTKAHILTALRVWINQRPGLECANYGDVSAYRSELRSITRDRKDALTLLRAVELRDSITAEQILAAFPRAFSGRLSITEVFLVGGKTKHSYNTIEEASAGAEQIRQKTSAIVSIEARARMDYCTGQYWPTEYRKAAAAVLASVLWDYFRDNMPAPDGKITRNGFEHDSIKGMSPGDYLRQTAKREFGRTIQARWFN
jgi:hypothetical protein